MAAKAAKAAKAVVAARNFPQVIASAPRSSSGRRERERERSKNIFKSSFRLRERDVSTLDVVDVVVAGVLQRQQQHRALC